mgnify:CR=1 FL=1
MKGKVTENFKEVIKNYLNKYSLKDDVFYEKCKNPKKSLDDCITYILNRVQKSGQNGFTDDEIFGMAIHYFEEEIIDIGKDIKTDVIVNHRVELTEEEIQEERRLAKERIYNEEREKIVNPSKKKEEKSEQEVAQKSLLF